jgi:type I restriction enzyme S subunit
VSIPTVPIGELVDIRGGGTPSKSNAAFWDGDIPWVSPKDMKTWEIADSEDKITSQAIKGSATTLIPENAILVVNRSGILKRTLPVGITRRAVTINQDIKALVAGPRAHPEYIAHMVKAAEPIVLKWVRATTADNFPIENLRTLEIPFPKLDEQRRIAAILDKADALRRKRKRAIELLDSLTQSIFLEMFGDPVSNSKHWPTPFLSDVCKRITVGVVVKPASYYKPAGIPAVRSLNIRENDFDLADLVFVGASDNEGQLAKSRIYRDDVLIVRTGQPGKAAVVPESLDGANAIDILITTTNRDKLNPVYFCDLLNSNAGKTMVLENKRGQIQQHLNAGSLKSARLPVPPLATQNEYVIRSDKVRADKLRFNASLKNLESFFSSLQSRAFSGEL